MQAAVREAETGLQEFMESSKELEAELEADISQSSKRIAEMQAEMEGVRAQAEDWKSRYHKAFAEHNSVLGELHRELSKLRESHDTYKTKLRNMELDNDELENTERCVAADQHDLVITPGHGGAV